MHGRLARAAPSLARADLEPAQSSMEMAELRQVQVLPVVLGVFLALLAIGTVGHALVTVVQRRVHGDRVCPAGGAPRGPSLLGGQDRLQF